MAVLVADASVTLPWCFEDEATAWTDSLLDRLRSGDEISVPAHWPIEVSNALLMALRRKRIRPGRFELFWDQLSALPITVEPALSHRQTKSVFTLCEQHRLTMYDGTYLELAKRKGIPLASLDKDLLRAALPEGVVVLSEPTTPVL